MLGSGTCIAILCPQLLVPSRDYFEGQLECQLQPSAPCKKEVASEQPVCCLVCLHWIVPESIAIAGCVLHEQVASSMAICFESPRLFA